MLGGSALLALAGVCLWPVARHRRLCSITLIAAAFVLWTAIGAHWGLAPFQSERRLATWLAAFAIILALDLGALDADQVKFCTRAFIISAVLLAGYGIWLAAAAKHAQGGPFPAVTATYSNHDCFAALMLIALGLCMGMAIEAETTELILVTLASCVIATTIVLSQCRIAVAALFLLPFAVLSALRGRRQLGQKLTRACLGPALACVAGLVLILCFNFSNPFSRVTSLLTDQSWDDIEVRRLVLTGFVKTWSENPVLGCGIDNFHEAFQRDRPHGRFPLYINQAHCDPVQIVVETGLVGALLMVALWLTAGRGLWNMRRRSASAWIGVWTGCAGLLVYSLANFAIPVASDLIWCAALLGLAVAWTRTPSRREMDLDAGSPPTRGQLLAYGLGVPVVLCCSLWCAVTGWNTWCSARWMAVCQQQEKSHDWGNAFGSVSRALTFEPRNEELYLARAHISQMLGQGCSDDLRRALQLNPRQKSLRYEAALMYENAGDSTTAEKVLVDATRDYREDPRNWAALGDLQARAGRWSAAATSYYQAGCIDYPYDAALASALAKMQSISHDGAAQVVEWARSYPEQRERLKKVALQAAGNDPAFFEAVLQWSPQDADAIVALAHAGEARGDVALAERFFRQLCDGPAVPAADRSKALAGLVELELRHHRDGEAIRILQKELSSYPNDNDVRTRLIAIYQSQAKLEDAVHLAQQGQQQNPDSALWQATLADLHAQQGLNRLAVHEYEEALQKDPDNAQYKQRLSQLSGK
jgi:Tfp pilus assembly protein PilF